MQRFYPQRDSLPDARVRVVLSIDPEGRVIEARTEESGFANPAFEQALLEEVRRTRYPADERYVTAEFSYWFSSSRPQPLRPVQELDAHRAHLVERIGEQARRIFAGTPPPAGARLRAAFTVTPQGRVERARIESSGFRSAAFDGAVLAEIRALRFAPDTRYAPTDFWYEFGAGQAGR